MFCSFTHTTRSIVYGRERIIASDRLSDATEVITFTLLTGARYRGIIYSQCMSPRPTRPQPVVCISEEAQEKGPVAVI